MSAAGDGSDGILLQHEGPVSWITLDRPDRLNAFAGTMRRDLHDALAAVEERPVARVVVITGTGRAFSAGADVDVMSDLLTRRDDDAFEALVDAGRRVVRLLRELRIPVIAAINGPAAGAGASLALACDFRIASDAAAIGFTFTRIGLHPDWGATYFLPRIVGLARATELLVSARMVDAREAEQLGIFGRVVPADAFQSAVRAYAEEIAAKPPLAMAALKRTMARTFESDLSDMLGEEVQAQLRCFRSDDAREGIAAFRGKRSAVFRGR